MGQEIHQVTFTPETFAEFERRLRRETELLIAWEREGRLRGELAHLGFELEGWLIDGDGMPAPRNQAFLAQLDDPLVVPELARFNFEINNDPIALGPGMFERLQRSLQDRWRRCEAAARALDMQALSIGILPTVGREHLHLGNISPLARYRALNEQVFRLREGAPIELQIDGPESLRHVHDDVMLESAATSLQIHLQTGSEQAVRVINGAKIVSAAMVAIGANSPFFLQHRLWEETRIPLFEQAVSVGGSDYSRRVTFGVRYARDSLLETFVANLERYPVLLPDLMDEPPERLAHLRLHNGTIWRWNRPLVGFDADGRPHYRIEHRVVAAGTSALDVVADTAFFVGLMAALVRRERPLEDELPFQRARDNFYRAARYGLAAEVDWTEGRRGRLDALIGEVLMPMAAQGLRALGLAQGEIDDWLGIVADRAASGRTGAAWQRRWVERHGPDWRGLVLAYAERQAHSRPVHEWAP